MRYRISTRTRKLPFISGWCSLSNLFSSSFTGFRNWQMSISNLHPGLMLMRWPLWSTMINHFWFFTRNCTIVTSMLAFKGAPQSSSVLNHITTTVNSSTTYWVCSYCVMWCLLFSKTMYCCDRCPEPSDPRVAPPVAVGDHWRICLPIPVLCSVPLLSAQEVR